MTTNDSTSEWYRRASVSARVASRRRMELADRRHDSAWARGFVIGLLAGVLFAAAWFEPMVR